VNLLDLAILGVTATAVVGGYRLGILTGATAWVFLIQGLVLATQLISALNDWPRSLDPGIRLFLAAVAFLCIGFAAQFTGRWLGARFRRELPTAELRRADRVAGGVAAPVAVTVALWLLVLPPMSQFEGITAQLARNSAIARAIDSVFPDPPDTSRALRRLAGPAGMPEVFKGLAPALNAGPPPAESGLSEETMARVAASTVKVEGVACRSERDGSGFAVLPEVVATNAHVVAGQRRTTVIRPDGRRLAAVVAVFDAQRDLALLRVPGLGESPLRLGGADPGSKGAVFGHPDGQNALKVSPASIRQQVDAAGRDLYDDTVTRRDIFILAANLRPGDSGAGLVNAAGEVVGVAFAIAPDRKATAYALTAAELRPLLRADRSRPADTGPCIL